MPHDGTVDDALEGAVAVRVTPGLLYLAWRRYGIQRDVAEDLIQAATLTYLQVRERYPNRDEHTRILAGIFRNKCREHLASKARATRNLHALSTTLSAGAGDATSAKVEATMGGGVLGELVQKEEGRRILGALGRLRPQAREMFRLIAEEGITRKELMVRMALNPNTLDSRLHAYRKELRDLLGDAKAGRLGAW